jgi:hypothetical protein
LFPAAPRRAIVCGQIADNGRHFEKSTGRFVGPNQLLHRLADTFVAAARAGDKRRTLAGVARDRGFEDIEGSPPAFGLHLRQSTIVHARRDVTAKSS